MNNKKLVERMQELIEQVGYESVMQSVLDCLDSNEVEGIIESIEYDMNNM